MILLVTMWNFQMTLMEKRRKRITEAFADDEDEDEDDMDAMRDAEGLTKPKKRINKSGKFVR